MSKSSHPSILKGKKILELLLNEDNKKLDAKRNENKVALRALEDEILALIPGATLDVYNYTKKNEYGNPLNRVSYLKQAQSNNGQQYGTEPIPAFRTILMYASAYNFTRVVRELIRQNPKLLNRRNDEETPALVYACLSKSTESALILIANGEHLDDVSPTDSSFCYKDPIISSVLKSSDPRAAAIEELTRLKLFNGRSMGGRTRKNARARRNKTRNQRRRI
jgi:ankyrin repeat protein